MTMMTMIALLEQQLRTKKGRYDLVRYSEVSGQACTYQSNLSKATAVRQKW